MEIDIKTLYCFGTLDWDCMESWIWWRKTKAGTYRKMLFSQQNALIILIKTTNILSMKGKLFGTWNILYEIFIIKMNFSSLFVFFSNFQAVFSYFSEIIYVSKKSFVKKENTFEILRIVLIEYLVFTLLYLFLRGSISLVSHFSSFLFFSKNNS